MSVLKIHSVPWSFMSICNGEAALRCCAISRLSAACVIFQREKGEMHSRITWPATPIIQADYFFHLLEPLFSDGKTSGKLFNLG